MLDPEHGDDLQELPSSDDDDADELRDRLRKLAASGVESPEFTSPIGSPPDEGLLSAKGRFMELKRMMREDKKARKSKKKAKTKATEPDLEGFESVGAEDAEEDDEDWEHEGSISPASYHDDVDQLLESFRAERASERGGDYSLMSQTSRIEHPKLLEVCGQLRERDQRILGLESKLLELDRTVIELQDTVGEKEKLLNSKNDAVNCMIAQYQQSIVERDLELGRTQETLFELERKFGSAQEQWKLEKEKLNGEIKTQSLRLKDLEDTNKLLESVRVETTSRDLELEEKLSVLKSDRDRLTVENVRIQALLDQLQEEKGTWEQSIQEKTELSLSQLRVELESENNRIKEEAEAKLTKMKKQFQTKLKSVKEASVEAVESKAVQDLQAQLNELLEKLQEKAAETEEFHSTIERLESELASVQKLELPERIVDDELAIQLQTQNSNLQSQLEDQHAQFKELSTQNFNLQQQFEESEAKLSQILSTNSSLRQEVEDLKNKLIETEPSKKETDDEDSEATELLIKITELEDRIANLQEENGRLTLLTEEISSLKSEKENSEADFNSRLAEYELNFTKTIEDYDKMIKDQEQKASEATTALQKSKETMAKMKKQFQAKLKSIREGNAESSQSTSASPDAELHTKCSQLEQRIAELEDEKGANLYLQEELAQLRSEKEKLETQHQAQIQDYQSQIEELKDELERSVARAESMQDQQVAQSSSSQPVNFFSPPPPYTADAGDATDGAWGWEDSEEIPSARITALEHQVAELEEEKGSSLLNQEEEISRLKSEREALEATTQAAAAEYQAKITELELQLAKSNETMVKLKRQFQHKLKQLREENNSKISATSSTSSSPLPPTDNENLLQEKITTLEQRLAELEEEKGNLLLQLVDFDEQQARRNVDNSSENVKLEINLAEREEEVRRLQDQLSEMTSALSQKNGEVEQLMRTCSELEASLQTNIEELSSSISTKDEEISAQLSSLEAQLAEKEEELQNMSSKLLESETKFEEMKALVEEYQGIVEGVRGRDAEELVNLKEELEAIREKAASAEATFESAKSSYNAQLAQRTEIIADLKSKLEETCKNFATLTERHEKKESELEILSSQLSSYEGEIEELKKQKLEEETALENVDLHNSAAEMEEKEAQFKALEQQLLDELGQKNDQLQGINWQLENAKLEYESSISSIRQENEGLKNQINELSTYSENLKQELDSLRSHYANFEGNYNSIYMELGAKSNQLEQAEATLAELRSQISSLEAEKSSLQLQSESNASEAGALRQKLTELTNEYIQLRESLEARESEAQTLRQDADTLQAEYSQSSGELKLKISSLMDQLNDCENEISVVSSRLKESDDICSETKTALDSALAALEEKSAALEAKTKALESAEHATFEKTEELLKLEEKLSKLEEAHKLELESNLVTYSNDLDATYEQLAVAANEVRALKEKLSMNEDQNAQLELQARDNFEQQLSEARERTQSLEAQLSASALQFSELLAHDGRQSEIIQQLSAELEENKRQISSLSVEVEELRALSRQEAPQQLQNIWGMPSTDAASDPFAVIATPTLEIQEKEQQLAQIEVETQLKDLQIQGLGVQIRDLSIELEELRKLNLQNQQQTQHQQLQDLWATPSQTNQNEGEKDQRIYELEVQLAELQINLEDANSQAGELSELKTSLEILSYKIKELEDENERLRSELHRLRSAPEPTPQFFTPMPIQSSEPVAEPTIVPSTAYVTTESEVQQSSSAAELENAKKEIKELKIKNGKMMHRFKQLKDKYDALLKEQEELKSKKSFSLDSAFEDEFMSQVTAKDALLEEKGKALAELTAENSRLSEKIDLLERGTERLTEMKEEQDRTIQNLASNRRALETEVSALKWKIEELENISLSRVPNVESQSQSQQQQSAPFTAEANQGYFDLQVTDSNAQENASLRQQNFVLSTELSSLQNEISTHKSSLDELHERNQILEEELEKMQQLQIESRQSQNVSSVPPGLNNQAASISAELSSLQAQLQVESDEKLVLERKIELLQSKISEIEVSEIKCFEESLMLKGWTRQLELDNLKLQSELERIYGSIQDGDSSGIKVKVLQDEVMRLVDALQDRDKRCEQLTVEITRLLEERDTLQLKLSNVLRSNVSLHEEVNKGRDSSPSNASHPPSDIPSYDKEGLKEKLAELEQMNYSMGIDLRREREARRLVQEQLFFSSSSRAYGTRGHSPPASPPRRSGTPTTTLTSTPASLPPLTPTPRTVVSEADTAQFQAQYFQPPTPTVESSTPQVPDNSSHVPSQYQLNI